MPKINQIQSNRGTSFKRPWLESFWAKNDDTGLGALVVCRLDGCSFVGNRRVLPLESHTYWPRHDPGMATGRRPRDGLVQTAMRAHANCVENLPLYTAVVIALLVTKASSPWLDVLAVILLAARIAQSTLHIGPKQTELVAGARFGCYAVQIVCMIIMGAWAAVAAG